jgi:integrase/recombinase XerD
LKHAGDVPLNQITTDTLRAFLIWLRTEYQPYRITGTERALSNNTNRNIYMFLSSFYTWAGRELNLPNPLKGVPAPKFEQVPVEPFTKEEITALLKACEFSRGRVECRFDRPAGSARCRQDAARPEGSD